jgi:REP element-mobilizing transposase RayT
MSGDKYLIRNQNAVYFITCTVIYWIDLFSRVGYKDIIVNSLNYCIKNKGLTVYAWVIMTNHIHLVASCSPPFGMSGFLRDFKKYTSKRFIDEMGKIHESRAEWLLDRFAYEASRTGRAEYYKIWRDDNHAIDLTNIDVFQKVAYIHNNPVMAGLVFEPDQYPYSSALDYNGKKGLVTVTQIT